MKPWSKIAGYLVSLSVLVLLWDGILRLGLVNADLLPTPVAVLWSLVKLGVSPDFWLDISVTFARSLLGLLGGALVAIPLGTLMALQKPVRGFFEPLVKASYSLPKIALIPLLILWFGVGTTTTVLAVMFSTLLPILVYTYHGVEGTPRVLLWSATAMGTGPGEAIWRVHLPAALPAILTGLRVGLGFSFVIAIATEMIASDHGVGKLMFQYGENGAYAPMFAALFVVITLAAGLDIACLRFSEATLRWHDSHSARQ